ncbi:MAG: helix-turn-helix transcriptional regulator [Rubrivivax sp.]|nr:helix-turn-helix transcriptional regulator [Rubrivivax sp.]MCA3258208.1 helix-turn-helix transcriptional regulator [Rubrivivax sp.]
MSLGAKLAELRLRKGESLQTVATAVGVSKTHVWQLEKGNSENPSIDLLKKLAAHYSVPVTFLADANADATLNDAEAQQFFRDFKSLSDTERDILKQTLQVFKSKKVPGDGST